VKNYLLERMKDILEAMIERYIKERGGERTATEHIAYRQSWEKFQQLQVVTLP